jgi:hypothetical protein
LGHDRKGVHIDQKTFERLKERARLNGRSLQQEGTALLERVAETLPMREARRLSEDGANGSVDGRRSTARD